MRVAAYVTAPTPHWTEILERVALVVGTGWITRKVQRPSAVGHDAPHEASARKEPAHERPCPNRSRLLTHAA